MAIGRADGSKFESTSADAAVTHNDSPTHGDAAKHHRKAPIISAGRTQHPSKSAGPTEHHHKAPSTTASRTVAQGKVPHNSPHGHGDHAPARKTVSGTAAARISVNPSRAKPKPGYAEAVFDGDNSKIMTLANSIPANPPKNAALTYKKVAEIGLVTRRDPNLPSVVDPKSAMSSDKAIMNKANSSDPIARFFVERAIRENQHDRIITSLAQFNQPREHTQEYYISLAGHIDDAVDWMTGSHPEDSRDVEHVRTPKLDRFRDVLSQFTEKQNPDVDDYPPLSTEIFSKIALKFAQSAHIIDNNRRVLDRTAFHTFMLIVKTHGTVDQYQTLMWAFNEAWDENKWLAKPDQNEKFRTASSVPPRLDSAVAAEQNGTASKVRAKFNIPHIAARSITSSQAATTSDNAPTPIFDPKVLSDVTAMINEIRRTLAQSGGATAHLQKLRTQLKSTANSYFPKMTGKLDRDQRLSSVPDPKIAMALDNIIILRGDHFSEIKLAVGVLVRQNQWGRIIEGLTALNRAGEISLAPQIDDAVDWMVSQHPGDGRVSKNIREAQLGRLEKVLSRFSGGVSPLNGTIFVELVLNFAKDAYIIDKNKNVLDQTSFGRFAAIIKTYATVDQYQTLMNAFNDAWIESKFPAEPHQEATSTTPPRVVSKD
jgi:hypothetical protein